MKKILITLCTLLILIFAVRLIYKTLTEGMFAWGIKKDPTAKFELFYTSQEGDPDLVASAGEVYKINDDTVLHVCIKNTNVYFVTINPNDKKIYYQRIIKNEELGHPDITNEFFVLTGVNKDKVLFGFNDAKIEHTKIYLYDFKTDKYKELKFGKIKRISRRPFIAENGKVVFYETKHNKISSVEIYNPKTGKIEQGLDLSKKDCSHFGYLRKNKMAMISKSDNDKAHRKIIGIYDLEQNKIINFPKTHYPHMVQYKRMGGNTVLFITQDLNGKQAVEAYYAETNTIKTLTDNIDKIDFQPTASGQANATVAFIKFNDEYYTLDIFTGKKIKLDIKNKKDINKILPIDLGKNKYLLSEPSGMSLIDLNTGKITKTGKKIIFISTYTGYPLNDDTTIVINSYTTNSFIFDHKTNELKMGPGLISQDFRNIVYESFIPISDTKALFMYKEVYSGLEKRFGVSGGIIMQCIEAMCDGHGNNSFCRYYNSLPQYSVLAIELFTR